MDADYYQQGPRQGGRHGGRGRGSSTPCREWAKGNCSYGNSCRFSHEGGQQGFVGNTRNRSQSFNALGGGGGVFSRMEGGGSGVFGRCACTHSKETKDHPSRLGDVFLRLFKLPIV
eukprot:240901-Prorocentrum_minimum.AAC.4